MDRIDKDIRMDSSAESQETSSVVSDLLYAQTERANGFVGRDSTDILTDMDKIIAVTESAGTQ
ncbi:MAG: hypothetical protein IJA20_02005 [Methanocorpusculum sp.]|nr:hypothetical protein [Oscillospiraceae bacterium]MBQ3569426.1 hypothetical protein [Methanocorpusculum sp.]